MSNEREVLAITIVNAPQRVAGGWIQRLQLTLASAMPGHPVHATTHIEAKTRPKLERELEGHKRALRDKALAAVIFNPGDLACLRAGLCSGWILGAGGLVPNPLRERDDWSGLMDPPKAREEIEA